MKSFKLLAGSVVLLGSVALAIPGFAGEHGDKGDWQHRGGGFDGHGGKRIEKLLDLTDEQKATLKTQREAQQDSREVQQAKIAGARKALATAVESGANDAELNVLAETLGKLHAEQVLAGAKARKAFIAVLTDEQKQKLVDLKAKREARREERKDAREHHRNSSNSANDA
ncbi:MAG: hypothetical protein B0W54_04485 [Cellvibrio sp. 79]|nr:MAG: hypothetical protein B0W54_04485 [Cellvibrio sp. 79]